MYAHMKRLWIICSVMVVIICLLLICMVNLLKWSNKSMRLYCPPNILPDVSDPNYMKTVSACLAALGTEYLVQANIQQNQKERYVMMSTVVATTVAAFESDIATSLLSWTPHVVNIRERQLRSLMARMERRVIA